MVQANPTDIWGLVKGRPQVDPHALADAIRDEVHRERLDFRTRLLIRDGVEALRGYWGNARFAEWFLGCPERAALEQILGEDLGEPGFPSLRGRLMEATDPEDIRQFLREVGSSLHRTLTVSLGGSAALMLPGLLTRNTDDIDFVNEVPPEIRTQYALLERLEKRYGLKLAHFQSHYLPQGWQDRVHSIEPFGRLQIHLVDPLDVFLSKLFSSRDKDLDDLRLLFPQFDKESIVNRLRDTTQDMLVAPGLREKAEKNWYILFGEALPT